MTWLAGATVVLAAALILDVLIARRRPLLASALWNAVLVAALTLPAAAWLLPRVELAVLPAEKPIVRTAKNLEWVRVTSQGEVVAQPGPPEPAPGTFALTPGNYALLPQASAFAPLPERPKPAVWRDWRADVGATLALVYAAGILALLLRLAANLWAVARLRRGGRAVDSPLWLARFEYWRRRVTPWRAVALLVSDKVSVPIVLGWWRPAIVIPAGLAEEMDASLIDAVLVHELAHVERADCGWQLVERLVQAIYWFHPLVWLASRRIAAVRERACDDYAIRALADREAYAATLIAMATRLSRRQRLGLAMAVVRTSKLEQRLVAIEQSAGQPRCQTRTRVSLAIVVCVLAATAATLTLRVVRAEQPASTDPPKPERTGNTTEDATKTNTEELTDSTPQETAQPAKNFKLHEAQRTWIAQLNQSDYAALAGSFDAKLKAELSPEKLAASITDLKKAYGKLRSIRSDWESRRYGLASFQILPLKFEQAELELRIAIDRQSGEIGALWIASVESTAAPPGFDGDTLQFGVSSDTAKANLALTAKAVDDDGQPVNVQFVFFAAMEVDDPRLLPDDWFDLTTFSHWMKISSDGDTAKLLPPGRYRVTALVPPDASGASHHARYTVSEVVTLKEGSGNSVISLKVGRGSTLVVRPVDADTGQSLDDVRLTLSRSEQDFPPGWETHSRKDERQPGIYTFDELPQGTYRLRGEKRAHSPTDVERSLVERPMQIEIKPDENQEVTVKFRTARLDAPEIAKRWPWVATGRVTDPHGRPIAGATVRAATGYGTLRGGGSTTTHADGRYELRFAEGIMFMEDPVSLQSALIFASKPGHYETNLSRQGKLAMARLQPDEKALKNRASPQLVFLPNEPGEVNFTLAKAATLRVELVDEEGESLRNTNIVLDGETLPPGSSALAQADTSFGGDYTFEQVPLGLEWWLYASTGRKVSGRSQPFILSEPGEYRVTVKLRPGEEPGKHVLKIESFSFSNTDVKSQVLKGLGAVP